MNDDNERIISLLADINEKLSWAPWCPQHLWTAERCKAEAERQRFQQLPQTAPDGFEVMR